MTTKQLRELRKVNPMQFWDALYSLIVDEYPLVIQWIMSSIPYAVEALQREFDPMAPLSQYIMPINTDNGVFNFKYSVHWVAHNEAQTRNPIPIIIAYYPMPCESWFTLLLLQDDNGKLNMEVFPPHYFKQFVERKTRFTTHHLGDDISREFAEPDLKKWLQDWDWERKTKHRIPAFEQNNSPKHFSNTIWTDLQCLDYYLVSDFLHFNKYVFSEHNPSALASRYRVQVEGDANKKVKQWVSVWPYGVSFSEDIGERVMMHKTYVSMPMLQPDQINALLPIIRDVWKNAFETFPEQYLPLHLLDDISLQATLREL